jgi:hypothetical protein
MGIEKTKNINGHVSPAGDVCVWGGGQGKKIEKIGEIFFFFFFFFFFI